MCLCLCLISPLAKVINFVLDTPVIKRGKALYLFMKKKMGFVEDVVVIVRRVKKMKKAVGKSIMQCDLCPHSVNIQKYHALSLSLLLTSVNNYHTLTHSLPLL